VSSKRIPHPRSVPGPFYVTAGCCTACGVPDEAPDVFEYDDGHCFVKRQPVTLDELQRTLNVVRCSDRFPPNGAAAQGRVSFVV
jgi:hypothetical protein